MDVVDVELADGKRSVREIVRHPGAAVVLGQLPDGRYAFVRQFRKAVEKVLLEVVAGTLEPGEAPEECARRELCEEVGHAAVRLTRLGTVYPAPGYTEEALHVFFAELDPEKVLAEADEDERIDVVYLTHDAVESAIAGGAIEDAKTLAAWLLYLRRGDLVV